MTWARRIAERDLDCFLLGTAMGFLGGVPYQLWGRSGRVFAQLGSELELPQRPELRVPLALALGAVTRLVVAVPAADRAEPLAIGLADRVERHGEQELVARLRAEVDLHPVEGD